MSSSPIESVDVSLRPVRHADSDAMLRWMQNPDVAKNLGLRSAPSIEKTRQWIDRAATDETVSPHAIIAFGNHVGNVVLDRIDRLIGAARLSIYIGEPAARGRGVGRSAIRLTLRHAFGELNLHKVWLTVHCENAVAIQTYIACGFSIEGVLRDEFVIGDRRLNAIYMGVLASDLEARGECSAQ